MRKSASRNGRANKRRLRIYANLAGIEVGDGFPTRLMAAINVSPESFFAASVARSHRVLAQRVREATEAGASFIDLGAMSTAPYRKGWIPAEEERRRLVAAVRVARAETHLPLSVDTQRAEVAAAALAAGARIVNDVSGLAADPEMADIARQAEGVVLMAQPTTRELRPTLVLVEQLLRACLRRARQARIATERIVLDPGIGFYRLASRPWFEVDLDILRHLQRFRRFGRPLLVGASRKSFLGKITGRDDPNERLPASLAAAAIAVLHGASVIRAHDVAPTRDAVRVAEAVARGLR
ncbi:MAG: dihydropteroate synthase [Candidatus Binatia bacterium]|nr:MAG: dihydropteroate synthase [Candidatus Binatia bacterium]